METLLKKRCEKFKQEKKFGWFFNCGKKNVTFGIEKKNS